MNPAARNHMATSTPSLEDFKLADLPEKLHLPRRRDLSFWVVLLFAVLPIWSVVPLSWAFVLYSLRSGSVWTYPWYGKALFAAALCEVFFSAYHYNLSRFISGQGPHPPLSLVELQGALKRVLQAGLADLPEDGFDEESLDVDRPGSPAEVITVLEVDDPRAVDFRNYLRSWFKKAPWSSIRRNEFHAWLYWSIFNAPFTSFEALPPLHQKVLQEATQMVESRAGAKIPEGSNPNVKPLLLTLDPVNVAWRPFVWYVAVALSNMLLRKYFRNSWNAQAGTFNGLDYVLRVPSGWDPLTGPRPIVFMHGLGLGLTQYQRFLIHLFRQLPNHPVLIPLQPHVSQEIFHPNYLHPLNRRQMADCLAGLLSELGWADQNDREGEDSTLLEAVKTSADATMPKGVTMLSHSNGSFTHAWMLKHHPNMVTRSCFVDPVTFCGWEGDLCYNFVYRSCTTGMELVIKYFVGTELGVANFLQRHFDWSSNSLFYEEIPAARDPSKNMFILGGKDAIVNAERVKRYLTSHGIRKGLCYDPNGRHGEALLAGTSGQKTILQWLKQA